MTPRDAWQIQDVVLDGMQADVPGVVPLEELPEGAQGIVRRAEQALNGGDVFICRDAARHPDAHWLFVCGDHPATGLMCFEHWVQHVEDHHSDKVCSVCGEHVEVLSPQPFTAPAEGLAVVSTDGQRGTWSGWVTIQWCSCALCAVIPS